MPPAGRGNNRQSNTRTIRLFTTRNHLGVHSRIAICVSLRSFVVISSQVIASTSGCLDLRCLLQVPLPSSGSRVHSGSSMSSVIPRSLAAINTLSSWQIFLKPISAHDLVEAYFMDLKDLYYGSRLAN